MVAYALGIYLLNIFLLFLTPRFDPAETDESPILPCSRDDEFRPFVRRLPEFRCWTNATWATGAALLATMFSVFDIPVFWPILLFYWVLLTFVTLRRQIAHMLKYKYVPFDFAKKRYVVN